ncbi:MAG: tetratricopeptide repeat protein [Myxococcales bacterium]
MRKPSCSSIVARFPLAFPAAVLLGGAGCAAGRINASEVAALKEEVATLRRERRLDEKRLQALEDQFDAQQAELSRLHLSDGGASLPSLQVVHLARLGRPPKALPPVPTRVAVREPDPADLAALDDAATRGPQDNPSEGADALFDQAFGKLKTGDLVGAAADFQSFAERYPRNTAADNALLDEGIALYGQHRYGEALSVLARIEARYPAGDAVPEALWRAADCEEQLGRVDDARKRLRHLAKDYPQSPEGARAREKLGGAGSASSPSSSDAVATKEVSP